MHLIFKHNPTGKTIKCDTYCIKIEEETLTINAYYVLCNICPYYINNSIGFDDWDKFLNESTIMFQHNGCEYCADLFPYSSIPEIDSTILMRLKNIRIIKYLSSKGDLLFRVPRLHLNLPYCERTPYLILPPLEFHGRIWQLCNAHLNEGNYVLHLEKTEDKQGDCWDGACLYLKNANLDEYERISNDACNICWILSLWSGKYVMWDQSLHMFNDETTWKLSLKSGFANSENKPSMLAHAFCCPISFINTIRERYLEYEGSWRYTIHWLTLALSCKDIGSMTMILSMLFERLANAIYCGETGLTYTKDKSFFQRGCFCRDKGKGKYSDSDIQQIVDARNNAMHGTDIVYLSNASLLTHIISLVKINYSTILALLGYTSRFCVRQNIATPFDIYDEASSMVACKLNFAYTHKPN